MITIFLSNFQILNNTYKIQDDKINNIFNEHLLDDPPLSSNFDMDDSTKGSGVNQSVRIYVNNQSESLNKEGFFEISSVPSKDMFLVNGDFNFTFQNNFTTDYIIENNDAIYAEDFISFNYNTGYSGITFTNGSVMSGYFDYLTDNNNATYIMVNATNGVLNFTISANFTDTLYTSGVINGNIEFNRSHILSLISSLTFTLYDDANLTVRLKDSYQSIWNDLISTLPINSSLGRQKLKEHIINENLNLIDLSNICEIQFIFERWDKTSFNARLFEYDLRATYAFDLPITNQSYVALEFDLKGLNSTVNGFYAWIRTLDLAKASTSKLNITLYRANRTIVRTDANLRNIDLGINYNEMIDTKLIDYLEDKLTYFQFNIINTRNLNLYNYFIVIKSTNSDEVYSLVTLPWFDYGDAKTEHQLKTTSNDGNNWINAKKVIQTTALPYTSGQLDASSFMLNVTRGYMPSDFIVNDNQTLRIQNMALENVIINSYPYNESSFLTWGLGRWTYNFSTPIEDDLSNKFRVDLTWNSSVTKGFKFNLIYSVNAYWIENALATYSANYDEDPKWTFEYNLNKTLQDFDKWSYLEFWYIYPNYFTAYCLTDPNNQQILNQTSGQSDLSEDSSKFKIIVPNHLTSLDGIYTLNLTSFNFINSMHSFINNNTNLLETFGFMYGDNISVSLGIQDPNLKAPISGSANVSLFYPNGSKYLNAELTSSTGIIEDSMLLYDFNNQTIINLTPTVTVFGEYHLGFFWFNGSAIGCKKLNIFIVPDLNTTIIWTLNPLVIDEFGGGNYTWTEASLYPWCTGTGTWNDPYVIENVIINGLDLGSCIEIRNSLAFFIIRNCTLYNSNQGTYPNGNAGINLVNVENGNLIDNDCSNNLGEGIRFWNCTYNNLSNNKVNYNTKSGIHLWYSDHNNLSRNKAINNNAVGIRLMTSHSNTLSRNSASLNSNGFEISSSDNNLLLNNTVIYSSWDGIYVYDSVENNLLKNNFSNNVRFGVQLSFSNENNLSLNFVSNNNDYGIYLGHSDTSLIIDNTIKSNFGGICLNSSLNNKIYNNSFISNGQNAIDNSIGTLWDNGALGNYWTDYFGVDIDDNGIGDSPYNITGIAGAQDNFPIWDDGHNGSKIIIDNSASNNWNWAITRTWCTGSGTSLNPYMIENITINGQNSSSCIEIRNSKVFFIILGGNFYNSSQVWSAGGIKLYNVGNGTLLNNNCSNNNWNGIFLYYSDSNQVINCTANNNKYGIKVDSSNYCNFTGNIANNNIEGINLIGNNHSIINNRVAFNSWAGINAYGSYYIKIIRNTAKNNGVSGIRLNQGSMKIWVINNSLGSNQLEGIYVYKSNESLIIGNIIYNNSQDGISIRESYNNTITRNIIRNNPQRGIYIDYSENNLFFNNSFIDNGGNAIDHGPDNQWDNGSLGNYWDDYTGVDVDDDGIGDTPYLISGSAGSQDYYPIWWDSLIISIVSPSFNEVYGSEAPSYMISVDYGIPYNCWYTLDYGITNFSFFVGIPGIINQGAWNVIPNGSVTITFYINDSIGYINSESVIIWKDIISPNIIINSPNSNELFGINAPNYDLTVSDGNLDKLWYYLDNGTVKTINTSITQYIWFIDQNRWDEIGNGTVLIRFYANDTLGNEGFAEVLIRKDIIAPIIDIFNPEESEMFKLSAPFYNISIQEYNLDSIWYVLSNTTYTSDIYLITYLSGNIDSIAWEAFHDGNIQIIFYANDTAGNIGQQIINIQKVFEYWNLDPFIIDDTGIGNYTWTEAVLNLWCSGSGTISDPYILEYIEINGFNLSSCIIIKNSNMYFIIRNCRFYNSSSGMYDAGIRLEYVTNGRLISINCSNNNGNGIILYNCQNVIIEENSVNDNNRNGIFLYNSSNISIINNKNTINNNNNNGIHLILSHNNTISGNTINYNSIGIYLSESNYNNITGNDLRFNNKACEEIDSVGNVIINNLGIEYAPPINIIFIIIIVSIITIALSGGISTIYILKKRNKDNEQKQLIKIEKRKQKIKETLQKRIVKIENLIQENEIERAIIKLKEYGVIAVDNNLNEIMEVIQAKINYCNNLNLNRINQAKRTIFELATKYTRLQIIDIVERSGIDDEEFLIKIIQEMIENKEIYAEFFSTSKAVAFDQQKNIAEIDMLMEPYKELAEVDMDKGVEVLKEVDSEIPSEEEMIISPTPIPTEIPEFNIFLSYSTLDAENFEIQKTAETLEQFPEIEKVLFWEADSSANIVEYMEETLRNTNVFILFCSENSMNSKAVRDEWQAAFQLRKKELMKIIPVYENEDYIPYLLMPLLNIKFQKDNFEEFIQKLYNEILRP